MKTFLVGVRDHCRSASTRFHALAHRLRGADYILAVVAFAVMCALLTDFKLIRSDQMFGDSAMYFQATENIASHGHAVSQTKAAIEHYNFFTTPTRDIAKDPVSLFGKHPAVSEFNLLQSHAYFILFPLAQLVRLFPVQGVFMTLYALSFTGLALLTYMMLRGNAVSIGASTLFCLLIVTQPTWGEGILRGQFYPDRLFLLAGFGFMMLSGSVNRKPASAAGNRLWLLLVAVACAAANERGALVAAIFLFLHTILYWRSVEGNRAYRLALSAVLFLYGWGVLKLMIAGNAEYHEFLPKNLEALSYLLQKPGFVSSALLFLVVNAPLLLLSAFEWRAAVIAMVLMLPNLLGNIGGAEKIGWSTHYPTYFFPSLVWAAASGYNVFQEAAVARCVTRPIRGYSVTDALFSDIKPLRIPVRYETCQRRPKLCLRFSARDRHLFDQVWC